jgi:hypothetical protein
VHGTLSGCGEPGIQPRQIYVSLLSSYSQSFLAVSLISGITPRAIATMPDPISIVGGVASVVQLTDVVGRLSKELYQFFWSIKDASDEMKNLRYALQNLEETMALLQHHGNPINGLDKAPENSANNADADSGIDLTMNSAITTSLTSLQRELGELKSNLPNTQVQRKSIRLRWVLDKHRTMGIISSIERHKSTLQLAMIDLGLWVPSCILSSSPHSILNYWM